MLTLAELQDTKRYPKQSFEAVSEPIKGSLKPRTDPMVRIRIVSWTNGQTIPGGHVIPVGTHEAVVFAKDVPMIKELYVEHEPEKVEAARKAFDRKVRQSIKDQLDARVDKSEDGAETLALLKEAYDQFPGSVPALFRQFEDRDIKPFVSVEVIEEGLVAPAAKAVTDMQTMTADLVTKAVSQNGAENAALIAKVVAETVAETLKGLGLATPAAPKNDQKR